LKRRQERIGQKTMLQFAEKFDGAMAYILTSADPITFMKPEFCGMRFNRGDGLSEPKFLQAIETLKRGKYYSASIAGMKETFKENPAFIQHFNSREGIAYTDNAWKGFISQATQAAHDFMREEVFVGNHLEDHAVYHLDIGLEVTPCHEDGKSFLVNMDHAETRMKRICRSKRIADVYGNDHPADRDDRRGAESVENAALLEEDDESVFEMGNFHTPNDIHGIPGFVASLEGEENDAVEEAWVPEDEEQRDLSEEDMRNEIKTLGVNTFGKFLSNGSIGGVHTGPAPLYFKEVAREEFEYVDEENIVSERTIRPCRTRMKVCGGQVYGPGIMADFLTKQRKNLDQFACIPNLLTRILSTNPCVLEGNRAEIFATFTNLIDIFEGYIGDVKNRLNHSSQHSVRFEFFFMSRLEDGPTDMRFPVVKLCPSVLVVEHSRLTSEIQRDFDENLEPMCVLAEHLRGDPESDGRTIPTPEMFHPAIKTRLVSCSELLVAMVDVRGFQGRIMNILKNRTDGAGNIKDFFTIPEEFKVNVEGLEGGMDCLAYGLDTRLLRLPPVSCFLSASRQKTCFFTNNSPLLCKHRDRTTL
jgi:hypothetical protein